MYVCTHLINKYDNNFPMRFLKDQKMVKFISKTGCGDFESLFKEIKEIKTKGVVYDKESGERNKRMKIVLYVYGDFFDFIGDSTEINVFISKNFLSSVMDL